MIPRLPPLAVLFLASFAALVAAPRAQSSWTLRNIYPTCNNLNSVTWKGGSFVAVGDAGTVVVSEDGVVWTAKKTGIYENLLSVAGTGKLYVAVGIGGTLITSEDGTAWTRGNSGTSTDLNSVTWTGKRIIAVGDSGLILTSLDGTAWTKLYSGHKYDLVSVDWNGTVSTALASNGWKFTSADGESWSMVNAFESYTFGEMKSIAANSTRQIAIGDSGIGYVTSDGKTWYNASTYRKTDFLGAAVTDSLYVITGKGGVLGTRARNTTGWEWPKTGTTNTLRAAAGSDSALVAVGDNGTILVSRNAIDWKSASRGVAKELKSIAWTGSQCVAVGRAVMTSSDGVYWTVRDTCCLTTYGLNGVAWTGSELVAVGGYGTYGTSPDGIRWNSTSGKLTLSSLKGAVSNGKVTLAFGGGGLVHSTATFKHDSDMYDWYGAAWTGKLFVAVGWSGELWTSPDGADWTERQAGHDGLYSVAGNESRIVAVGYRGAILSSPDGTTWAPQASGVQSDLNGVTWTGRQYVAVGRNGVILASEDGMKWTRKYSGTNKTLYSVASTGAKFFVAGENGVILESPDDLPPPVGVYDRLSSRPHPSFGSGFTIRWQSGKLLVAPDLAGRDGMQNRVFDVSGARYPAVQRGR